MATYAIGDIQGCHATLQALLARLRFDPGADRVLLVGDLVNRGPGSLEVLRWARALDDRCVAVLGNHDLHLVARALGARSAKPGDTLDPVLAAPDVGELVRWLRERPLLHQEGAHVLVHAGLLPAWSVAEAAALAREVEATLRGDGAADLLAARTRRTPRRWDPALSPSARRQVVLHALTRLRACSRTGTMALEYDGPPERAPRGLIPWFQVPGRRSADATIVFGHWASLGLRIGPGYAALDSGCVWGGALTALRLDDGAVFQEPAEPRLATTAPRDPR